MKKTVLILCTGNSARSQMAEGLLRHDAGDRFEVASAGTRPGQVRSEAIAVMNELGIDISDHRSKHVDEFRDQSFDYGGPGHAECAKMCIASGLPVGLKTGDGTIYVLIRKQLPPNSQPSAMHQSLNAQIAQYAAKIVT